MTEEEKLHRLFRGLNPTYASPTLRPTTFDEFLQTLKWKYGATHMASSLRQDIVAAIPYTGAGRTGLGPNLAKVTKDPSDRDEILKRLNELTERFSNLEERLKERQTRSN